MQIKKGNVKFSVCDCKKGARILSGDPKIKSHVCAVCREEVVDIQVLTCVLNLIPAPCSNYSDAELIRHIEHYYPILDNSLAELFKRFKDKLSENNGS